MDYASDEQCASMEYIVDEPLRIPARSKRSASHIHAPPSSRQQTNSTGIVGQQTTVRAQQQAQQPSHRVRGAAATTAVAPSTRKTQTRWPQQKPEKIDNHKPSTMNNPTRSLRNQRRRSSSALKSFNTNIGNRSEFIRSQRKCRSNEFHPGYTHSRQIDTDDSNVTRDSDTNLLIENMRNRECELIKKINNKGYYCCSSSSENDDLVYLIRKQNSMANVREMFGENVKRRRSPGAANKFTRCNNSRSLEMPKRVTILNQSVQKEMRQSVIEYQSDTTTKAQKIKFTITINRNSGIQTAGYQRMEFNSGTELIARQNVDNVQSNLGEISDDSENCTSSSNNTVTNDDDYRLSNSINENNGTLNRSGEYHDCCESSLNGRNVTISRSSNFSSTTSVYEDALDCQFDEIQLTQKQPVKMEPTNQQQHSKEQSANPMLSIVQELTANNVISSTIQIDKEKVELFKKSHVSQTIPPTRAKPKRITIIGDNFCNEVFRSLEERNLSPLNDKSSVNRFHKNNVDQVSNSSDSVFSSAMTDSLPITKLECNRKYTGRSIGRLLAARLENNQMLGESRKQLLKKLAKENEPNIIPPAKPPRSFTSMSSPSSKQSCSDGIVSATTVPIGELFMNEMVQRPYKEVFEPSFSEIHKQQEANAQFGWVALMKAEAENNEGAPIGWTGPINSMTRNNNNGIVSTQGGQHFGWAGPTNIPQKSGYMQQPEHAKSARDYQLPPQILDMLHYEQNRPINSIQTNHSKPQPHHVAFQIPEQENIDTVDSSAYFDRFSGESFPCSTPMDTPVKTKLRAPIEPNPVVANIEISQPVASSRAAVGFIEPQRGSGKKAANAIKKTKSIIGASKKFLRKPLNRKSPKRSPIDKPHISASAEKSQKDGDETVKFNSENCSPYKYEKKSVKHLGFTPKKSNLANTEDSPTRDRSKCQENLIRSGIPSNSNKSNKNNADKKSATMLVRINRFAKSPKKLLRSLSTGKKSPADPSLGPNASMEEHFYYKSYNGNNSKVPLMREILGDLRQKVTGEEADTHSPPSARRSLFQEDHASSDALDDLSNRIVEIDLHDEPEPLYAEISQTYPKNTNGLSAIVGPSRPVDTKEVYINSGNESDPPRRYIMVNNDPRILYATIGDKAANASSSESLDINVVNNFAGSMQNIIDRKFLHGNGSRLEPIRSPSVTDYYSGRDFSESEEGDLPKEERHRIPLSDITSLDTFQTENLYESDTDLNDAIKDDITKLECSPLNFDEISSGSESGSIGGRGLILASGGAILEDVIESDEEGEESEQKLNELERSRDTADFEIRQIHASVDYARGINTVPSISKKSVKRSPSYREMKSKFRDSVKKGTKYIKQEGRKISDMFENSLTKNEKRDASISPRKKRKPTDINKYLASRFNNSLNLADANVKNLCTQLQQQMEVQDELHDAIAYCRITTEFENSAEIVEAECLGLISQLKESAIENELELMCADDGRMDYVSGLKAGHLQINTVRFSLRDDIVYDAQHNYFYVCTCTYRGEVQSTKVKERTGNKVLFNDCGIEFISVDPKFSIQLEVHALCLRKSRAQNRPDESPISNKGKSHTSRPNVSNSQLFTTANTTIDSLDGSSDVSMFKLLGSTILTSFDLCNQAKLIDYMNSSNAHRHTYSTNELKAFDFSVIVDRNHLMHKIDVGFHTDITFMASSLTGFLNIGDCNSNWNRRWCSLDGFVLKFWNYPQDFSVMEPVSTINLSSCACENIIVAASREVCPKPRSFVIDILMQCKTAERERKIKRYFISTDTSNELKLWLFEINRVINFIRNWHIS